MTDRTNNRFEAFPISVCHIILNGLRDKKFAFNIKIYNSE